jgi:hypothetical protein
MNILFLTSLNVAHTDDELLATIDMLAGYIEDGTIAATVSGDTIESLCLSAYGQSLLPTPTLPTLPATTA